MTEKKGKDTIADFGTDQSILDVNLEQVSEAVFLHDGAEAKVRCMTANLTRLGDKELPAIALVLQVIDAPGEDIDVSDMDPIFETVWLPREDDEPFRQKQSLRRLKGVVQAFDVPVGADLDLGAFVGKEAWVKVKFVSDDYGESNRVKRYLQQA